MELDEVGGRGRGHGHSQVDDYDVDDERGVLYDILVFREWTAGVSPNGQRTGGQSESDGDVVEENATGHASKGSLCKVRIPGCANTSVSRTGWLGRLSSLLTSTKPYEQFSDLQDLRMSWKFSVTTDCSKVAVACDDTLEILTHNTQCYVLVAQAAITEDPNPHLRLLSWSPDASLLVLTTSSGRVYVYDETATLIYSLTALSLPSWDLSGDTKSNFCCLFFDDSCDGDGDWMTKLMLVHSSGTITSFLLSLSGYQDVLSYNVSFVYPYGVTDCVFLRDRQLIYVSGPSTRSDCGITCWRLTDEEPFMVEVELRSDTPGAGFLGSMWRRQSKASSDFVYSMSVSPSGTRLAAVHMSGTISVWSLPGLVKLKTITMPEQPCHDDINPQILQRSNSIWTTVLHQNPTRWHPVTFMWWSEKALVVGRLSGGLTIISAEGQTETTNLLGESAEFFSPAFESSQRFESGFFVLEAELSHAANGGEGEEADESQEETLLEKLKKLSLPQWTGRDDVLQRDLSLNCTYRLLYFQSTSPQELYQKKIMSEEYGEAIILARHYALDCDLVYERQWILSKHSKTDIEDYLSKITNLGLLMRLCLTTIPESLDVAEELIVFAIQRLRADQSQDYDEEFKDSCLQKLSDFLEKVETYRYILRKNEEFVASCFHEFRIRSILESARAFALSGNLSSLEALFQIHDGEVGVHVRSILRLLPESIDPMLYVPLLKKIDGDAQWFSERAEEFVANGSQVEHAVTLLDIASNMSVARDVQQYHRLCAFKTLTVEKQITDVAYAKVKELRNEEILQLIFSDTPDSTILSDFKRHGIPFLDRVEQCKEGESFRVASLTIQAWAVESFRKAAEVTKCLLDNIDETWLNRSDLLHLGIDVITQSGIDTDMTDLSSFMSLLQAHFRNCDKLEELSKVIQSISVLRKHKICSKVSEMLQTSSDCEAAQDFLHDMLAVRLRQTKVQKIQWHEELRDVFLFQEGFEKVLSKDVAFKVFCQALLESEDDGCIQLGFKMLKGSFTSDPGLINIDACLTDFEVRLPSKEEVHKIGEASADRYIKSARNFVDSKLRCARTCLSLCKTRGKLHCLLDVFDGLAQLKLTSDLNPRCITALATSSDIVAFVKKNITLRPFSVSFKERVLHLVGLIWEANSITDSSSLLRAKVLTGMLEKAIELRDSQACDSLCDDMLTSGISSEGWRACYQRAMAEDCDPDRKNKLLKQVAAICESSMIEETVKNQREAGTAKKAKTVHLKIPGIDFFENNLVFSRTVVTDHDNDLRLDSFGVGVREGHVGADEVISRFDDVFIEDPLLALSALLNKQPDEPWSDMMRIAFVLNKALTTLWPAFQKDSLNCTVYQLVGLLRQDTEFWRENFANPLKKRTVEEERFLLRVDEIDMTEKNDIHQGEGVDSPGATSSEIRETRESRPKSPWEIGYDNLKTAGVPRGFQTLFNVMKKYKP